MQSSHNKYSLCRHFLVLYTIPSNFEMKAFMLANLSLSVLYYGPYAHIIPWPLSLLFLSLFSFILFIVNFWLVPGGFAWRNHNGNSQKLHGLMDWPLLGTLPQMGPLAHRKLATMAKSIGATHLMAFSLGSVPVVISSHPDTAKEILSGSSFSDRPVKESARLLMFERAIGFAPSGNYWRNLRRIAANHMFSPRRISCLAGLRQHIAEEMVVGVRKEMEERGVVEVRGIFKKGSLSNIIESVFGGSLGTEREETLGLMVKEGYELIAEFNWADYFPIGFLDFHGVKRRCHRVAVEVSGLLGEMVKERKHGGEYAGRNDFLSILLTLPEEDRLTDKDMVAVLWVSLSSLYTHT